MNTHSRHFILLAAACLALLLLDRYGQIRWMHSVLEWVVVPVQRVVFDTRQTLFQSTSNDTSVQPAEKDLAQARVDAVELQRLRAENADLRRQLEAPLPSTIDYVPAHVLRYADAQLMIDRGSREGLQEGMTAVVEKQYIGTLSHVSATTSLVNTPLQPQSKVPVETVTSGARGLLQMAGDFLLMDKVLQEYDIASDELVVTAGSDMVLRDLVIGSVKEVKFEHQELFKQAIVTPAVDYEKLRRVFVIVRK